MTSRGQPSLQLYVDLAGGIARIEGQAVVLNGANVILVANADTPSAAKIVGTVTIDPQRPALIGSEFLEMLVRRSAELVDFAQLAP